MCFIKKKVRNGKKMLFKNVRCRDQTSSVSRYFSVAVIKCRGLRKGLIWLTIPEGESLVAGKAWPGNPKPADNVLSKH